MIIMLIFLIGCFNTLMTNYFCTDDTVTNSTSRYAYKLEVTKSSISVLIVN